MSRTGSARSSFLDDLLADDFDKPSSANAAKRGGKSVRFMDNEDNSGSDFMSSLMSSTRERPRTGDTFDRSTKSDTSTPANRQTSAAKSSSKSDWLGLGDGEDLVDRAPKAQTATDITPKASVDQKDDWLNSGLSARKSRATHESRSATESGDKAEDDSWLGIRKRAEESRTKISDEKEEKRQESVSPMQKSDANESKANVSANKSEPEISPKISKSNEMPNDMQSMQIESQTSEAIGSTALNTSSVMLLRTQVKMLELEKTFLQQTLDQIKVNHCEELKIMSALHEQQMAMTTDMYKRHEQMVQEERDRRINDLKTQLSQSERDIEDMRRRNNERVQYLENEWQREVERLKTSHTESVAKASEQHEQDLQRLRRIKEQEIESVNALQNHGLSLEALLAKWEKSGQQIEELHRSVITKQEEILKHKFEDIETKNKRLDDVELNWHSLITELEIERNRCSEESKKLYDIIDQQKQLLQTEQKLVIEDKLQLEAQTRRLNKEKHSFDTESVRVRDGLRKETEAVNEERIKLKDELNSLEAKRNEINLKEIESKQSLTKEREEISRLFKEVEDRRNELHREATQLQHQRMALQGEQHQLEQRKLMFDVEKNKMQDLAHEIAKRAEELETLSEIALHEKREGHQAMDEADRFKKELDSKVRFIEESFAKLRTEEERIDKTRVRVQQDLEYIKETKDNIVCSLCGSGLNRAKLNGLTKNSAPDFNQLPAFVGPHQWPGMQDSERALLVWQITGQQDAQLLEQETAFINAIRSQTQTTTGIAFQQNDYYIN